MIILAAILAVNLVISITRFTSYSAFMGDFKAALYVTKITKQASKTSVNFEIIGKSGFMAKNAYFSGASCVLSIDGQPLGIYQFSSNGVLGQFDGKDLTATATFDFSGDYAREISKFPSSPLKYTLYIVTHFLTGYHDTRGTFLFEGTAKEM